MTELQRLLAQYEQGIRTLSDEELDALLTEMRAEAEAAFDGDPDDETLDLLQQVAVAVQAIQAEKVTREEASAERGQNLADIRNAIFNTDGGDGGEPGDAGEGGEGEGEGAGEGEGEGEPAPQAVAAGAAAGNAGVTRQRTRPTRPPAMLPERHIDLPEREPMQLVAAANLPNVQAGTPLDNPESLARAFMAAHKSAQGYKGPRTKVPVARIGVEDARELYGPERFLGRDQQQNDRLINAVVRREATNMEALAAAGGICAPINVNYDMPTVGTEARPFRDKAMVRFGADRGGVSTFPPPTLADVDGAVDIWTEANDRNPTSPTTKPCLTITCPDEDTTLVEAITRCFEVGNFRARYWMEQVDAWVNLGAILHARTSEVELMTAVGGGSTQVTSGQLLGASQDVLTTLGRAVAQIQSRHRIDPGGAALVFAYPFWLHEIIRDDVVRQIPGTGTYAEKYTLADATIQDWFRSRNVMPVPFLDGESGQIFSDAQGDGPLNGWPSVVVTYLYPAGSWLFLDGGELDLGIVRDSTLNSTNDYQLFYESFEGAHYHGIESFRLSMDICPNGWTSGTVDITPCTTGS